MLHTLFSLMMVGLVFCSELAQQLVTWILFFSDIVSMNELLYYLHDLCHVKCPKDYVASQVQLKYI
jgi:ABC-type cobalamin transport system permease subunit